MKYDPLAMTIQHIDTPDGVRMVFNSDFGMVQVTTSAWRYSNSKVGAFHGGQTTYLQKWAKFQLLCKGAK